MPAREYGILCQPADEKMLVKHINAFLVGQGYRKLYKRTPSGYRDPDHPEREPRYSHYYCQFLKETPRWYFDLYPNGDLDGTQRFPGHPEAGWTLYVSKAQPEQNSAADDAALEAFFAALVEHTGFPCVLLRTYQPPENRI